MATTQPKVKTPRKVSLIDVRDYPKETYRWYWNIGVEGSEEEGYLWRAKIMSREPLGYEWQGKVYDTWPEGADKPAYPDDIRPGDFAPGADMEKAQEARRKKCAAIWEASPKAIHLVAEMMGTTDGTPIETVAPTFNANGVQVGTYTVKSFVHNRDDADTAAQAWVLEQMAKPEAKCQKPPVNPQAGYALALGPFDLLAQLLWKLFNIQGWLGKLFGPMLMALGYATAIRTNRMTQVLNAIDAGAGAGLFRIYDGSRPATCGTATTLLAEITLADPSGTVTTGVLTFSGTPLSDTSANATGTATWFRCVDSTGTCAVDGAVGTAGSDLNLNSTSISTGQEVQLTSAQITEGNA